MISVILWVYQSFLRAFYKKKKKKKKNSSVLRHHILNFYIILYEYGYLDFLRFLKKFS